MNGTIKKIIADKGFGFIKVDGAAEGDKDLFFHSKAVSGAAFTDLHEGDAVTFETEDSPKGPNAVNVQKA